MHSYSISELSLPSWASVKLAIDVWGMSSIGKKVNTIVMREIDPNPVSSKMQSDFQPVSDWEDEDEWEEDEDEWEEDEDEWAEWADDGNDQGPEGLYSPEEYKQYGDLMGDVFVRLAQSEQEFLGPGVVRLGKVLSAGTAAELRKFILNLLGEVGDLKLTHEGELADERQTKVRTPSAGSNAPQTRWDLRLPLSGVVHEALRELLGKGSLLGETLEIAAGPAAKLWELSAVVSAPGSAPQNVHPDYTIPEQLYTTFIALQPVSRDLGPTRFLPGTHMDLAAHAAREASLDVRQLSAPGEPPPLSYMGLLDTGDATMYDQKLLHCGCANTWAKPELSHIKTDAPVDGFRVMLSFTFLKSGVERITSERIRGQSIHPSYNDGIPLSVLRDADSLFT